MELPQNELETIKKLSVDVQMAVAGMEGTGIGGLVGLAAFGAGAIIAAPAMLCAGATFCVKGMNLKRKAEEDDLKVRQLSKEANEIVAFYRELRKAAEAHRNSVENVLDIYEECLARLEKTLLSKTELKSFAPEEKENYKRLKRYHNLLEEIVQTTLVIKPENEEDIEKVNSKAVMKLKKQAERIRIEAMHL